MATVVKTSIIFDAVIWVKGRCDQSPVSLPPRWPLCTVAKFCNAFFDSSGQLKVEWGRSLHTTHVKAIGDGNTEGDDWVSKLVKKDVRELIANSGWDSDRCRDSRLGDVVDLVSTTLAVLLCQSFFQNCFAVGVWFSTCGGFALLFLIASSDYVLKLM